MVKKPFANMERDVFNRWAVVVGLVLLAAIAAVVALPPMLSSLSQGTDAVSRAAGTASSETQKAIQKSALAGDALAFAREQIRTQLPGFPTLATADYRDASDADIRTYYTQNFPQNAEKLIAAVEDMRARYGISYVFFHEEPGGLGGGAGTEPVHRDAQGVVIASAGISSTPSVIVPVYRDSQGAWHRLDLSGIR